MASHGWLLLHRSVRAALDAGYVGVPVFVRCIASAEVHGAELVEALHRMVAAAGAWLGAPARRVYAQGGVEAGQVTVTLQYAGGQSALVSVQPVASGGTPRVDLMLLGNTGALYHEGGAPPPIDSTLAGGASGLPALPEALRRALEESLRVGRPVPLPLDEGA